MRERKERLGAAAKKAESVQSRLAGQEKLKIQMHQNIAYRQLAKKEREVHAEMEQLKQSIHQQDGEADGARRDYNKAHETISKCDMDSARLSGSINTTKQQIRELQTQLKEKAYRSIDKEHRDKLIEHKCVQMAVNDLNNYFKALNGVRACHAYTRFMRTPRAMPIIASTAFLPDCVTHHRM